MALLSITTPQGAFRQVSTAAGGAAARLVWSVGFAAKRNLMFGRAQSFVDSEVLRLMQPYTPQRTGMLIKSATLGTVIGSGRIKQTVPYAARQYYTTAATRSYDPRRGAYWFERMKADQKGYILRGAAQKMGAQSHE